MHKVTREQTCNPSGSDTEHDVRSRPKMADLRGLAGIGNFTKNRRLKQRGFAMVATLIIMSLIALLSIALLTLSTISVRTSEQSIAIAEARANARLALTIAIGQLQKEMGPDRRISATSDIYSSTSSTVSKPNLVGVWDSWHDYNPAFAPNYSDEKNTRFRRWLVSGRNETELQSRDFVNTGWTGDTIELVGSGSLGTNAPNSDKVTAGLVSVANDSEAQGAYAWHVSDESVKARFNQYRDPSQNATLAQKRALLGGHRPDASVIKGPDGNLLTQLPNDYTASAFTDANIVSGKIIDLDQTELLPQAEGKIKPLRHDITPYSMGVLTDVRGGGLKEDLSSIFEMNSLPAEFNNQRLYQSTHGITGISDPYWSALAGYYNSYKSLATPDTNPTLEVDPDAATLDPVPREYNPAPVITKVDTIFSIVGRPLTDVGWVRKDIHDYFIDMIFTPVVTLHNPYNVSISFHKLQVDFANMPVGFQFFLQEGGGGFRSKSVVAGTYESLNTMYQIPRFRGDKIFTVSIANWADTQPLSVNEDISGPIVLKPGQTLVCGPLFRPNSSFYRDTRAGYNGDAYNWHEDGGRGTGNITQKVKAGPAYTPGVGFETSATMIRNTMREEGLGSWCSYFMLRDQNANPKLSNSTVTDRFYVEFKMQRPFYYTEALHRTPLTFDTNDITPTFGVRAQLQATSSSPLVDYGNLQFNYTDTDTLESVFTDQVFRYPPTGSLTGSDVAAPGGILYNEQGAYVNPIAIFSAYTRTTNAGVYETGSRTRNPNDGPGVNLLQDGRLAGKPFLFHNPSRSNFVMNLGSQTPGIQAYEINFQPFLSKGDFEDYMDLDANNRVPSLTGNKTTSGIKSGSYLELPSGPIQTIADFRRSNALTTNYLPHFVQPVSNSLLHPLMSPNRVIETNNSIATYPLMDHSVLANHALYDRFYFSTFASRGSTDPETVFEQFMDGTSPLASQSFQPYLPGGITVEDAKADLYSSGTPVDTAYQKAAEYQMVKGPFNVNSTSVQAWKAVLASMNKSDVTTLWARSGALETEQAEGIAITGMSMPNGGANGTVNVDSTNIDNPRTNDWNGYRELTEPELERLAEYIVEEVRERGPFLSMSEFVNRQVGPSAPETLSGALEAAIEKSEINEEDNAVFPDTFLNQVPITAADVSDPQLYGYTTPEATTGNPAAGAPGWVSQGDLMRILEPAATVRGDTFVIRVYGEARNSKGETTARAYAEAVVQRVPLYIDPTDRPSVNVYTDTSASDTNETFGRRINLVSFRWLSDSEV